MILRRTMLIAPRLEGEIVCVMVYTANTHHPLGYFVTSSNTLILSDQGYDEFTGLDQAGKGKFVSRLQIVEPLKIQSLCADISAG